MSDAGSDEILVALDRPDPGRPILVSGLAAAALFDGAGEAVLSRETRGGVLAWGGVYGQGVRLTSPWHLRVVIGTNVYSLSATLGHLEARRWRLETRHTTPEVEIVQEVVVLPGEPAVGRRLVLASRAAAPLEVVIESEFAPFLAPVLVEGVKPYRYELRRRGLSLELRSHGFGLRLDADPPPERVAVNGAPWDGRDLTGEVGPVTTSHRLVLPPGGATSVAWVVAGGVERTLEGDPDLGSRALAARADWASAAAQEWRLWTSGTPTLRFPDEPRLEAAYGRARSALRALYTAPDGEILGLVAGYPWYAALWCRDLAWMLPSVLWLGDEAWFESSLRCVFRFQAGAHLPLLGAEVGELPMQISPGPVFLYGTSDTTLYYPDLVRRLVDHTGRVESAAPFLDPVARALAWARAKVRPETGFVHNGGEVLELRDAAAALSTTRYGFDALDTTIWDSTDRRDHAVDIQVLFYRALAAHARLSRLTGRPEAAADAGRDADALRDRFRRAYPWAAEAYLYDSLGATGAPVARVRPNALRAVATGLLSPEVDRTLVDRVAREDLTTPWGVRTLSRRDLAYDPAAYHDGQVWTIATAWAAEAALAVGEVDRGVGYLRTIADRILDEDGLANECYRGDRGTPFNSCFLLGFSVAPFLTVLFEQLWGIRPSAPEGILQVEPRFPHAWRDASLTGLHFAGGRVALRWTPDRLTVGWDGPRPILVRSGTRELAVAPGATATVPTDPAR